MKSLQEIILEEKSINIMESDLITEEVYDWLKDYGFKPNQKYRVADIENRIGRFLEPSEMKMLKAAGVLKLYK